MGKICQTRTGHGLPHWHRRDQELWENHLCQNLSLPSASCLGTYLWSFRTSSVRLYVFLADVPGAFKDKISVLQGATNFLLLKEYQLGWTTCKIFPLFLSFLMWWAVPGQHPSKKGRKCNGKAPGSGKSQGEHSSITVTHKADLMRGKLRYSQFEVALDSKKQQIENTSPTPLLPRFSFTPSFPAPPPAAQGWKWRLP